METIFTNHFWLGLSIFDLDLTKQLLNSGPHKQGRKIPQVYFLSLLYKNLQASDHFVLELYVTSRSKVQVTFNRSLDVGHCLPYSEDICLQTLLLLFKCANHLRRQKTLWLDSQ